ncbi:MAG: LamB/YcsF family protein [Lachnospiraceae bacterium]
MAYEVDLNADLGESFGAYRIGMDEEVLPFISSANVACGFHASDPVVMERTVALCQKNGTAIGAHPGYPDLVGFGRRKMAVSPAELKAMVIYQIGALSAFCKAAGVPLQHVKPHGAMYNMAAKDITLARAICEGIQSVDDGLILLGLSGSKLLEAAREIGLPCRSEVFADRGYQEDGSLVPRTQEGAMITDEDEAAARVVQMVTKGTVVAVTGAEIPVEADSICLHGDSKKAVLFAQKIHGALQDAGIRIRPMGSQ